MPLCTQYDLNPAVRKCRFEVHKKVDLRLTPKITSYKTLRQNLITHSELMHDSA